MRDEAEEEGQQEKKADKDVGATHASPVRKLLVYLGIAVALTALAFVVAAAVIKPILLPSKSVNRKQERYTFPFETLVVNPAQTNGSRFLKVTLYVESDSKELTSELEKKTPQLRNTLIMVLSSKSIEQVSDMAGKKNLQQEIVGKLNANLDTGKLKNVYFTEFVIQ